MNKLAYMRTNWQNFKHFCTPSKYAIQPRFEDKHVKSGIDFKHSWANMAHMHDLRVWTLAYAPGRKNNIRRVQEIHLLNQEMWYAVYRALWTRLLIVIPLWFFINRVAKAKYMKKQNNDSHDACYRATTAHM